ncbi:unnamed protein product [Scytosiphon promiscuus]
MAFKAFVVLVALCLVSLASGFVAPTSVARNGEYNAPLACHDFSLAPSPRGSMRPRGSCASSCFPEDPLASTPPAAISQLPTELLADNGTATLAIVVGMFIPCSFLVTLYFGTEQKKAGVIEGQEMNKK